MLSCFENLYKLVHFRTLLGLPNIGTFPHLSKHNLLSFLTQYSVEGMHCANTKLSLVSSSHFFRASIHQIAVEVKANTGTQ